MSLHTLNIRLDFPYRTGFTHGAFRPENDALASLMEQRPGGRVLVLMEEGLERFYPQLPADIDRYFEKNAGELAYAGEKCDTISAVETTEPLAAAIRR